MRAPTSVETSVHRKLTAASGIVQVEPPAKCSGRRGDVARISISALRRYVICRNLTDTPEASASPTPAAGKLVNIDKSGGSRQTRHKQHRSARPFAAMASEDESALLPHKLPSLHGFKVDRMLNDGKESGVVALLVRSPRRKTRSRPRFPTSIPDP